MVRRRWQFSSPVSWPVVVALGFASLAIGFPGDSHGSGARPRVEAARGPGPLSGDDLPDSTAPSLVNRRGRGLPDVARRAHGLPDAGLRPGRTMPHPAATRWAGSAPLTSHPGVQSRWTPLVTQGAQPGAWPALPARLPRHVLHCVWLT